MRIFLHITVIRCPNNIDRLYYSECILLKTVQTIVNNIEIIIIVLFVLKNIEILLLLYSNTQYRLYSEPSKEQHLILCTYNIPFKSYFVIVMSGRIYTKPKKHTMKIIT